MSIFAFVILLVVTLAVLGLLSSAPFMASLNPNIRWAIFAILGLIVLAFVLEFFGILPATLHWGHISNSK